MDRDVFTNKKYLKAGSAANETKWLSQILEQAARIFTSLALWPACQLRLCGEAAGLSHLVQLTRHRLPQVAAAAANALDHLTRSEAAVTAALDARRRLTHDMVHAVVAMGDQLKADAEASAAAGVDDVFAVEVPAGIKNDLTAAHDAKERKKRAFAAAQLLSAIGNLSTVEAGREMLAGKGHDGLTHLLSLLKGVRGGSHCLFSKKYSCNRASCWCWCGVTGNVWPAHVHRHPASRSGTRAWFLPTWWGERTRTPRKLQRNRCWHGWRRSSVFVPTRFLAFPGVQGGPLLLVLLASGTHHFPVRVLLDGVCFGRWALGVGRWALGFGAALRCSFLPRHKTSTCRSFVLLW